ncbi:MAG: phenylalanine--tRNA ligase subunit alpha [Bacilli bacterium]|nr:phenylalanine--tRNA ligase subunit alpha [Bacilli bacterium]MCI7622656.1 phenylalanine--tRNA ligase subunit alpha [Bacilli bacterium]MDY4828533.1 phenylalanine--tRNA ligase subunit alpha [Bacilli bacterium]MDY5248526.1 phenylalanine--tRNA ligase subunit alpha [Bacilli bacterium]MDY5455484.1 phenylalanine--tRNA ligase subunit alpha [Bacilli bacterium]
MDIFEEIILEADSLLKEVKNKNEFAEIKAKILGKNSKLSEAMEKLKTLPRESKAEFGKGLNIAKQKLVAKFDEVLKELDKKEIEEKIASQKIDITLPGRECDKGSIHPFEIIVNEVEEFFLGMGYKIAEGDEVEKDLYNFELLNIPHDHPSRDMQDSFFIDEETLLRSHTSSVQSHVMQEAHGQGPIKVICPGKVYRRDDDATHSHQFGQIEGLVIAEKVSLGDLMETLTLLMRKLFGEKREVRFRPSYFPFTEPSVEVDVSCFNCGGKGCSLCKNSGWIEVLGAGMVHPNVLRMNGFDDKKYQGFAFGVGIERLAMLKYGIDDIRKFYQNDVTFLDQFRKE